MGGVDATEERAWRGRGVRGSLGKPDLWGGVRGRQEPDDQLARAHA